MSEVIAHRQHALVLYGEVCIACIYSSRKSDGAPVVRKHAKESKPKGTVNTTPPRTSALARHATASLPRDLPRSHTQNALPFAWHFVPIPYSGVAATWNIRDLGYPWILCWVSGLIGTPQSPRKRCILAIFHEKKKT